jgi:integrase
MTTAPAILKQHAPPLPPLPAVRAQVITKDRQIVDTTGEVWSFRASTDGGRLLSMDWKSVLPVACRLSVSDRPVHILKIYLAYRLTFSKGMTVWNDFVMFRRFFRWYAAAARSAGANSYAPFDWSLVTEEIFRAFLEHGLSTASKGNDFARMREMYFWGAFGVQLPEFDRDLALALKTIRAQGNIKGAAVRFRDPLKGPLDSDEQRIVIQAIAAGAGTQFDRALLMLHLELGLNPQSAARMKNHDLRVFETKIVDGGRSRTIAKYQIQMPRVKKRKEFRETRTRPVSDQLGQLLVELQKGKPGDPLFHWLPPDSPEEGINQAMARFATAARLISPRTRSQLHLTPRRFRSTLATEMAREGASRARIAEVLDHTDLQNVGVYVEAASYVVDQLGEQFDRIFDPLLQRFRGRIVDSHTRSAFPGVPPKSIPGELVHLPTAPLNLGGIGMCGRDVHKDGLCRLAPPLTCYPCEFFAAFRTGPHAEVLAALEHIAGAMKPVSDSRIPLQLEDVMAAIRQLLAQIAQESGRKDTSA